MLQRSGLNGNMQVQMSVRPTTRIQGSDDDCRTRVTTEARRVITEIGQKGKGKKCQLETGSRTPDIYILGCRLLWFPYSV